MAAPQWSMHRNALERVAARADADEQEFLNLNAGMDEAMGEPSNGDLKMHDGGLGAAEAESNEIESGKSGWRASESGAPKTNGSSSNGLLSPTGNFQHDLQVHLGVECELMRIRRNKERRVARAKEQELAENAVAGEPPSQSATNNQAQAPRPRYDLYQISAHHNGPLHEGIQHLPGYTSTPAVQRYLEYDRGSYKLGMDGRPRDWPVEIYTLGPGGVERVGENIQKRFTVWMNSGLVIQVELYHDEDVEELMGFLRSGAAAAGATC